MHMFFEDWILEKTATFTISRTNCETHRCSERFSRRAQLMSLDIPRRHSHEVLKLKLSKREITQPALTFNQPYTFAFVLMCEVFRCALGREREHF